jgi:hypothetical protein
MGVRMFSSFGTCWTCTCGHNFEDDDVVHALGCSRLIGLTQSRHEDVCKSLLASWALLAVRGDTPGLHLAPPTVPKHAGTFTATCDPSLVTFSQTSRSSIPWLLRTFIPPPAPLAVQLLFETQNSAGTTLWTIVARDMHAARSLLKPWGSPGATQFLWEATHAAFPQPRHQCATCFCSWYNAITCLAC